MSPASIRLKPLGTFEERNGPDLECFSCGGYVPRLARFRDERGAVVLLCPECEADVLEELAVPDGEDH